VIDKVVCELWLTEQNYLSEMVEKFVMKDDRLVLQCHMRLVDVLKRMKVHQ